MAYLGNLIVTGVSRFLQKIYCDDIQVNGSAIFSAVTASSLTSTGTLSVTGAATLSSTLGVTGATTLSSTLKVNGASTLAAVTASGAVTLSSTLSVAGTATFSKTQDLSGTANNSPALIIGGTATSAHIEMDSNEIQTKTNGTSVADLYINTDGGTVFLSNGSKISAKDGLIATNNLNVVDTLRSSKWDLQSVSQLGGSFYISPTILFPSVTTTAAKLTVAKSNNVLTLTITDPSITSTTIAGSVWTANSKVKVSANINNVTTGTMNGTVTNINTSSHTMTLSVSGGNAAGVTANTYASTAYKDMSVMLYERRDTVNSTNVDYKVGIWMNCYDVINNSATIRIYSGTAAQPTTFLGNMTSANLPLVNNETPTGYGLFSDNVYLQGKIVANGGKIANWEIGQKGLYYTSDAPSSTSVTLIPDGTTASSTAIGGSSGSKSWVFTVKNIFGVDTSGNMFCNGGKIGGFTIGSSAIYNGTSALSGTGSTTAGVYVGTGGIRNYADANTYVHIASGKITAKGVDLSGTITATAGTIGGCTISDGTLTVPAANISGTLTASQINVSDLSALNATIGGFTIGSSSIYNGVTSLADTSHNGVYIGTDGITLGKGVFKVTNAGVLTATSATITGAITATSGTIGAASATNKITIGTNTTNASIYYGMSSLANTSSNGFYIGTDGIALGKGVFKVTNAGVLTATSATITGAITATSGTIGASNATNKITIGTNTTNASIYYGMSSLANTSSNGFYIGTDGIALGKGLFKVTSAGALTATSATITGAITATSGTIGSNSTAANNWQIGDRMIYYSSSTPGNSASTLVISTGTASTKSIGGSDTTSKNWMIAAGTGFGVTSAGVLYATGANISGTITATAGTIGGCSISDGVLQIAQANISGTLSASKVSVTDLSAFNATIGGFTIGSTSIHNGTDSISSTTAGVYVGTDGFRNYKDANTYVSISAGKITAKAVDLSGAITATSGTIGGVTVNSSYGIYTNSKTAANSTKTGFLISKDGAIYLGAYNSTDAACPFQVTSAGVLTAKGAVINGTITAGANSKIGPWNITTTSIYKTNSTMGNSTAGAAYFGNDGLSITNKFKVSAAGKLEATGADISGSITANSGTIGGWTISTTSNQDTTANGGHYFKHSIYNQTSDSTYEYEVGMRARGDQSNMTPQDHAFYVRRMNKGGKWDNNDSVRVFSVSFEGKIVTSQLSVDSISAHTSGNISIEQDASTAARFSVKCGTVREGRWQLNTDGNMGLFDVTNNSWIIRSATNQSVYVPHNFDVTGTLNVSSNVSSGNISITTTSSAQAKLGLKCTSVRQIGVQVNTDKNSGIYDTTNSSWIIRSASDQTVYIPHDTNINGLFKSQGWDGDTQRVPVQSNGSDGNRVGYISSNSSTVGIRGQWGSSGAAISNRTISCPASDIRLKTNIIDSDEYALNKILQIKMRAFDWKDSKLGHQKLGFVADELQIIDSRFAIGGGYDQDGTMNTKSVDTFYLQGYEVKAIQQLHEIIKQQQQRISALQQKLRDKEN